jgi:hypothetical protein
MIGSGSDIILHMMTMNKIFKDIDRGKDIVIGLSKQEIDGKKYQGLA